MCAHRLKVNELDYIKIYNIANLTLNLVNRYLLLEIFCENLLLKDLIPSL